jgi:hypothetical protein
MINKELSVAALLPRDYSTATTGVFSYCHLKLMDFEMGVYIVR